MTRLILVRHGQTLWNASGKHQGHLDSPLTELGIEQAEALARRLKELPIDHVYSSDLQRASETAAILVRHHGIPVHKDLRLRERNLGIFQSLTREEFRLQHPEAYHEYMHGGPDFVIPNGESFRQRTELACACLNELGRRHRHQTVLVVTHGGVLSGFFRTVVGISLKERRCFEIPNTGFNLFYLEKSHWKLAVWGDLTHLDGMVTEDDF